MSALRWWCLLLAGLPLLGLGAPQPHLSDYIRPFVGTQGEGNTYPGPSAPFGMIQLSPDTDRDLWDTASGYEYTDSSIMGFSLTHLNGTGIPDLGDFLFMPQIGEPKLVAGTKENPDAGTGLATRMTRNQPPPATTRSSCSITTSPWNSLPVNAPA